jgi:hypothetical protein
MESLYESILFAVLRYNKAFNYHHNFYFCFFVRTTISSKFETMVDISLNCRLFQDIEKEFTITTSTTNTIEKFKNDIKKKIKDFADIEADHLTLWQVWIHNNDLSNFTFNVKNKNIKKGVICDYWAEQPNNEFIHVIIDSPCLTVSKVDLTS